MSEEVSKAGTADLTGDAKAGLQARDQVFGADRKPQRRKRKVSYLTINKIDVVDYKDIALLRRFLNDRYKIHPSRQTGTTAHQQRLVTRAIHRAREMALLPFAIMEMGQDRRESRGPREHREYRGDRGDRGDRAPREPRAEAAPAAEAAAPAAE